MRGFPLFNIFLVIGFFALAWWPLRLTVAEHQTSAVDLTPEGMQSALDTDAEVVTESAVLRVVATRPIVAIRIEHLGEVLYAATDVSHPEIALPDFSVPAEGIDLWIEAMVSDVEDAPLTALKLELETSTGDLIQSTLWSEEDTFSDSVYLQPSY